MAAQHFSNVLSERYGFEVSPTVEGAIGGSTDFVSWYGKVTSSADVGQGNVTYGKFTRSNTNE